MNMKKIPLSTRDNFKREGILQTRLHVVHGLLSQLTVLVLSQLGGYQIWWLLNRFRNFVANRSCG
jgi:hypothetical protein